MIGRRLPKPLVSEKHHFPFSLGMLRTALTVCLARFYVLPLQTQVFTRAHSSRECDCEHWPILCVFCGLSNALTCSMVRDRISFRCCCGTLSPSAGFSRNKRQRTACCIAPFSHPGKPACAAELTFHYDDGARKPRLARDDSGQTISTS